MAAMQIGLVDYTRKLDPRLVQAAVVAFNLHVTQDLPRVWSGIQATVTYLPDPNHLPAGVWPVGLVATLPNAVGGEGGVHSDPNNQPCAQVIASPTDDSWTVDASHEILEMLVDPYGNNMQTSQSIVIAADGSIQDGGGLFNYLVEACDPCEAQACAYVLNGVAVSDFVTPNYYDAYPTSGMSYTFKGAIPAPRRLAPGGYISFINLAVNIWQQIRWLDPTLPPQLINLGAAPADLSLREWVDGTVAKAVKAGGIKRLVNARLLADCRAQREQAFAIGAARARDFKKLCGLPAEPAT
jgi:hypothetical protein